MRVYSSRRWLLWQWQLLLQSTSLSEDWSSRPTATVHSPHASWSQKFIYVESKGRRERIVLTIPHLLNYTKILIFPYYFPEQQPELVGPKNTPNTFLVLQTAFHWCMSAWWCIVIIVMRELPALEGCITPCTGNAKEGLKPWRRLKWASLYRNEREIKSGLELEVTWASQAVQGHNHLRFRLKFCAQYKQQKASLGSQEQAQPGAGSWDGVRWHLHPLSVGDEICHKQGTWSSPKLKRFQHNTITLHNIYLSYIHSEGRKMSSKNHNPLLNSYKILCCLPISKAPIV